MRFSLLSRNRTNYPKNKNRKKGYDIILTDGKYAKDTLKLMQENPSAVSIIDAGRVNYKVVGVCEEVKYIICSEEFANGVTGLKINDDYEKFVKQKKNIFSVFALSCSVVLVKKNIANKTKII